MVLKVVPENTETKIHSTNFEHIFLMNDEYVAK